MNEAKRIRLDRKKKLKRVFNYDAEMAFLEKFWELKQKNTSIDDFKVIIKDTLIDTKQISPVIAQYFVEELIVKEEIKQQQKELEKLNNKRKVILAKIDELYISIKDVDEETDTPNFGGSDPCKPTRTVNRSSC